MVVFDACEVSYNRRGYVHVKFVSGSSLATIIFIYRDIVFGRKYEDIDLSKRDSGETALIKGEETLGAKLKDSEGVTSWTNPKNKKLLLNYEHATEPPGFSPR